MDGSFFEGTVHCFIVQFNINLTDHHSKTKYLLYYFTAAIASWSGNGS